MISPIFLYFGVEKSGYSSILAIGVTITPGEGESSSLSFLDTNRERKWDGQLVRETKDGFVFLREDLEEFTFSVATIKVFDSSWRGQIEGIIPQFRYEADLHEFYRRRFRSS